MVDRRFYRHNIVGHYAPCARFDFAGFSIGRQNLLNILQRGGKLEMNQRIEVAQNVASRLFAVEEAIDTALACAADLIGTMPHARQQIGVSASVGQPAIEQVIASMSMLAEARRQMVAAHQSLAESAIAARVAPRNFGGFIDKTVPHAELSVVIDKRAG
jgi:hypothetical protein